MKKLICLCMALVLIMAIVFAAPVSAADDKLTVTSNGGYSRTYKVGDVITFFVGLNAGNKDILNGQAYIDYDSQYLQIVEHMVAVGKDDPTMEGYSFPRKIYKSSNVLNTENENIIRYNFTAANGVGKFNDVDQLFVRFRFKVIAPGTTDISNTIQYMCNTDEEYIYYNCEPDAEKKPVMFSKTMLSKGKVGDVNADGSVNNRDAVFLDRYIANWPGYDALILDYDLADLNRDGSVNNRDAIFLDRYIAGWGGAYAALIIELDR